MSIWIIITFFLYLAVMLGIGGYAWKRTHDLSDYILGGRSLGSFAAALSAGASDMSGWVLMGLPGYAYAAGLESVWLALGLFAGTWLNWQFVASRLREQSESVGNALTIPDYFEMRFKDRSGALRIISAFFILVFFTFYTSAGLVAGAKLFNAVFGLEYHTALLVGTLAVVAYTFLGGFMAVCWTDCIQGTLMFMALILVPVVAFFSRGSVEIPQHLLDPFHGDGGKAIGFVTVVSLMAWGVGYFGQPHILARFMAVKDVERVPRARYIAIVWSAVALTGGIMAGMAAIGIPVESMPGGDREKVFIKLIELYLHPVPAGICLAAILAAIMSTADSQLLVSSSALVEDFYKSFFRRKASEHELVMAGRGAVMFVALLAYALSINPESRVLDTVSYAWAGFGCAFGPAIILSLFWKGMTGRGALAGILTGGMVVIAWKPGITALADLWSFMTPLVGLYEMVPGFIAATAVIWIFSYVQR